MLEQNYIKIYENEAGEIVVVYAANGDSFLDLDDVQNIAVKKEDAYILAKGLCELADRMIVDEE